MFESCLEKQVQVRALFSTCTTQELKYQKIMELGKLLPPLPSCDKIEENLVAGCQSRMYLKTTLKEGKVIFHGESDALISAGLAAILIMVYSDESPETILKCPPSYLKDLGIDASLSPGRANGLYSMHLRMKQEALKLCMKQH